MDKLSRLLPADDQWAPGLLRAFGDMFAGTTQAEAVGAGIGVLAKSYRLVRMQSEPIAHHVVALVLGSLQSTIPWR